ncbi:DNA polymerase III subunit gamma/tau [Candidatus Saccharibacteria bacterium]|nr:DNA polymerase III subunit gamma/tau [Candidatus Saccharibacteria bacterium]
MGLALYRKYRPTTLDNVVGQSQITTALSQAIKSGKISHAYLFTGPRGTGKTSVARIFAHAINNFDYTVEDEYLDIIEIDAASNTSVDDIRELREKSIITPVKGKYKIYIIDEVHMLSKSAFNALLKTLEEPPAHVIFIMATTDAHKVPITISSRSQVYNFKLADPDTMLDFLTTVADKEKLKIDQDALKIITERGGGSFRDSLSLLDQISTLPKKPITASDVISALGLPDNQILDNLLTATKAGDFTKITTTLEQTLSSGIKIEVLIEELIKRILSNPDPRLITLLAKLSDIKPPFLEAKLTVALLGDTTNVTPQGIIAPPRPATPPTTPSPSDPPTTATANDTTFDWQDFLDTVKSQDTGIATMLKNFNYHLDGDSLHLYAPNSTNYKLLSSPKRQQFLAEITNLTIVIEPPDKKPAKKDPTLAKISAIMGDIQEVKNGEINPF